MIGVPSCSIFPLRVGGFGWVSFAAVLMQVAYSVEVAIAFLKEVGMYLSEVSPRGLHAIFERLRSILHEGQVSRWFCSRTLGFFFGMRFYSPPSSPRYMFVWEVSLMIFLSLQHIFETASRFDLCPFFFHLLRFLLCLGREALAIHD